MYNYMITRTFGESDDYDSSLSVSDRDPINCAHLLASGFNTMSRNVMNNFVLAVVDTKAGTVQYDGKVEKFERPGPPKAADEWPQNKFFSKTFNFEPSADTDTLVTLFGEAGTRIVYPGKLTLVQDEETTDELRKTSAAYITRPVLESAYAELQAVKEVLADAGVETIPADSGVRDLLAVKRAMSEQIAGLTHDREQANAAARAELIEHVKRAYAKWGQVDPGRQNENLKSNLRGMIEVLSKFLAATGEADADERHAVAKRLCGIPEGNYLYED